MEGLLVKFLTFNFTMLTFLYVNLVLSHFVNCTSDLYFA